MQKWKFKSIIQQTIGRMPKSYWWNCLFQKYVTRGYYPSRKTFSGKLACCQKHLENYRNHCKSDKKDLIALELGTGSWPIFPIGLFLCGVSEIWTFDLVPVLRRDTLKKTLQLFHDYHTKGDLQKLLPDVISERYSELKNVVQASKSHELSEILEKLNIHVPLAMHAIPG